MNKNPPRRKSVKIFTDSEAAVRALSSGRFVLKAVLNCHEVLNTLEKSNIVTLMWIPEHSDFTGNAKADELAKLGSEAAYIRPELGMAHGEAKKSITEWLSGTLRPMAENYRVGSL